MTNLLEKSKLLPICGFGAAYYAKEKSVVFTSDTFIKFTTHENERQTVNHIYMGKITSTFMTADHSVLLVAVEEEGNAKVLGLSTDKFEESFSLSVRSLVQAMATSSGSEVSLFLASFYFQAFACLSIVDERVTISTFQLANGQSDCYGTILVDSHNEKWELSFCPADEGVICALGGTQAYLMRCSGGKVENFSNIKLLNTLCHHWSNDVTMCFGTSQGELHLYRETIALEVIDLKNICRATANSTFNNVLMISSSSSWFGVVLTQGLILVFENSSSGPQWDKCKAIVVSSCNSPFDSVIAFDSSGDYVLYTNGTLLLESALKYTESIANSNGISIAARHSAPVVQIQITSRFLISLDKNGSLLVTSRKSGRHIVEDSIDDFLGCAMQSEEFGTFIRKSGIERRFLTVDGFVVKEFSSLPNITQCSCSADSSHIAVLQENFLIIFKTNDDSIIVEEKMKLKRDVNKIMFSTDAKYLIILTRKEEVFALDISTGKTIWTIDYKLKNFTDMTTYNGTVYLLDSKFIVTRVKHGKELSSLNMHASDVGFTCSSQLIAANDKMLVCSTNVGQIIVLEMAQLDNPYVFKHSVGTLIYLDMSFLSVGYSNGSVVLLEQSKEQQSKYNSFDFVLCDHVKYTNLTSLINGLDFERNAIREESEIIIREYKAEKENEIARLNEEYTIELRSLQAKVKSLQDRYKQSEEDRKRTIAHLEQLYKEEEKTSNEKFERLIDEQIKKNLKLEEQKSKTERAHQQEKEQVLAKVKEQYRETEYSLQVELGSLRDEVARLRKSLASSDGERERTIVEFKKKLEDFYQKRKEDTKILETEMWNLKATIVQLTEERDRCMNETYSEQTNLATARQQIVALNKGSESLQKIIEQNKAKFQEIERKDVDEKKKFNKIQQKLISKEKDLAEIEKKFHKTSRRCGELEARIQRIADCVYDSRRLEHAVLGLIAFMQNIDAEERFKLT